MGFFMSVRNGLKISGSLLVTAFFLNSAYVQAGPTEVLRAAQSVEKVAEKILAALKGLTTEEAAVLASQTTKAQGILSIAGSSKGLIESRLLALLSATGPLVLSEGKDMSQLVVQGIITNPQQAEKQLLQVLSAVNELYSAFSSDRVTALRVSGEAALGTAPSKATVSTGAGTRRFSGTTVAGGPVVKSVPVVESDKIAGLKEELSPEAKSLMSFTLDQMASLVKRDVSYHKLPDDAVTQQAIKEPQAYAFIVGSGASTACTLTANPNATAPATARQVPVGENPAYVYLWALANGVKIHNALGAPLFKVSDQTLAQRIGEGIRSYNGAEVIRAGIVVAALAKALNTSLADAIGRVEILASEECRFFARTIRQTIRASAESRKAVMDAAGKCSELI